jgi:hypothetical protein
MPCINCGADCSAKRLDFLLDPCPYPILVELDRRAAHTPPNFIDNLVQLSQTFVQFRLRELIHYLCFELGMGRKNIEQDGKMRRMWQSGYLSVILERYLPRTLLPKSTPMSTSELCSCFGVVTGRSVLTRLTTFRTALLSSSFNSKLPTVKSSLSFLASAPGVGEAVLLLCPALSGETDRRARFNDGTVADRKAEGDGLGPGRTDGFSANQRCQMSDQTKKRQTQRTKLRVNQNRSREGMVAAQMERGGLKVDVE